MFDYHASTVTNGEVIVSMNNVSEARFTFEMYFDESTEDLKMLTRRERDSQRDT